MLAQLATAAPAIASARTARAPTASRRAAALRCTPIRNVSVRSKNSAKKDLDFVADGGGAEGVCEIATVKEAIKECEGLEGAALEACYAEYGCDLKKVTEHYAKVAGIEKDKEGKK